MHHLRPLIAAVPLAIACGTASTPATAPSVDFRTNALSLPGVTDACYDLSVTSADGTVVWEQNGICSSQYGDGRGAISYVGPCDAGAGGSAVNTVALALSSLSGVDPDSWTNPTADGPLVQSFTCSENADVSVEFVLTVLRDADLGFVDVAVSFEDVFCSAKVDCVGDDGTPNELLTDPQTGERVPTAVVALACSAGPGDRTTLYADDLAIQCASGESYRVDPAIPGNHGGQPLLLAQSATWAGAQSLTSFDLVYWNVGLGLSAEALADPNGHLGCQLTGLATASGQPFANAAAPAGHPLIAVDVPVTAADGSLACTQHPLNGADGGMQVTSLPRPVSLVHQYGYDANGNLVFDGGANDTAAPTDTLPVP